MEHGARETGLGDDVVSTKGGRIPPQEHTSGWCWRMKWADTGSVQLGGSIRVVIYRGLRCL